MGPQSLWNRHPSAVRGRVAAETPNRHLPVMTDHREESKAPADAPPITVSWGDTKDVPLAFATNLHWRTLRDHCYLTFGQLELPVADGPIPPGTVLNIRPVARIAATPETVKAFAALLVSAAAEYERDKDK